jgi:hypothetical protein
VLPVAIVYLARSEIVFLNGLVHVSASTASWRECRLHVLKHMGLHVRVKTASCVLVASANLTHTQFFKYQFPQTSKLFWPKIFLEKDSRGKFCTHFWNLIDLSSEVIFCNVGMPREGTTSGVAMSKKTFPSWWRRTVPNWLPRLISKGVMDHPPSEITETRQVLSPS